MYLTEQEIMEQHIALNKTYDYMMEKKAEIKNFFSEHPSRKFVFFGCGSSYMLAKSGQQLICSCKGSSANAIAGGDYLVNPDFYEACIKDSIIVTLSRSGQTTEIVRDVQYIKKHYGNPVISLSMKDENDIMPYSELDITMDWCYDKSVCQTRTVTNLYTAMLMLTAFYNEDEELLASVKAAVDCNQEYKETYRGVLAEISKKDWGNAIVLADGAPIGIAEEGALAFTEISMLPGQCFHLLDYRHGPMVLNGEKTLTVILVQPNEDQLQRDMIEDLKSHGGTIVTVSKYEGNEFGVNANICLKGIERFEAWGIPFIYVCQMAAYEKSILLGRNPDQPTGLDAFITLKSV